MAAAGLILRGLLWTLLLPGVVAFYVPYRWLGLSQVRLDWSDPLHVMGLLMGVVGLILLTACIVEFARRGQGTLSPLDPPRLLVVGGLYRYVRNPMYLSVTLILLGEALFARSRVLAVYWAVWFAWVNVFVIAYEEPALRRQFAHSYDEYARRVRRWIPRLRPTAIGPHPDGP